MRRRPADPTNRSRAGRVYDSAGQRRQQWGAGNQDALYATPESAIRRPAEALLMELDHRPDQLITDADRCVECGALVHGGQPGCQALWDNLSVQFFTDRGLAAVRDLAFDTYCMQHIEPYCQSAKSYAAHLTRLCCGLEHAGNPQLYAAINRWLNGPAAVEKPLALQERGHITIADIAAAPTVPEQIEQIRRWAQTVWTAYAAQHDLAHAWIRAALGASDVPQR